VCPFSRSGARQCGDLTSSSENLRSRSRVRHQLPHRHQTLRNPTGRRAGGQVGHRTRLHGRVDQVQVHHPQLPTAASHGPRRWCSRSVSRPSPSVWPRSARIAESLLGATVVATTACSPLASFAAPSRLTSGRNRCCLNQLLARWRDADPAPAVDLVGKPGHSCPPAVQPSYVGIARRHGLGICGHLVRSARGNQGTVTEAAELTGIDGADPVA
jgi:hypothetical protein